MTIRQFEDIIAWQKAQDLAVLIYQTFGNMRDFGFKDQICRATLSVSNNIAEGFDRGTDKEFIQFLIYARGSNSEVKSMIYLALRLQYIDEKTQSTFIAQIESVGKLINALIRSIRGQNK